MTPIIGGTIMAEFYKHSGTVPVAGAIQTAFAGLGTAITLAWAYSYAIVWIPIVYINFLLTLGFGAAIGFLIVRAAKAGRIRSSSVPALIGLISGLAGLYVASRRTTGARNRPRSWTSWPSPPRT